MYVPDIFMLSQINRRKNVVIFHLTTLGMFGKKILSQTRSNDLSAGVQSSSVSYCFSNTTIYIIQGISCEFIVLRVIRLFIFGIRPHSVALIKKDTNYTELKWLAIYAVR